MGGWWGAEGGGCPGLLLVLVDLITGWVGYGGPSGKKPGYVVMRSKMIFAFDGVAYRIR